MDYDIFIQTIEKIKLFIKELKEDNITDFNRLFKYVSFVNTIIPDDLKIQIIKKPLIAEACIKSIKNLINKYKNKLSYDDVVSKLLKKEIITYENLNIIYKSFLQFMIDLGITKSIYDSKEEVKLKNIYIKNIFTTNEDIQSIIINNNETEEIQTEIKDNDDLVLEQERLLFNENLKGSVIKECKINNKILTITKYNPLLIHLYSQTDKKTILKNKSLNILEEEINEKGFKYYEKLGLSIQRVDSIHTLKEIIKFIKILKYKIELKIKLKNDEIFIFKNTF